MELSGAWPLLDNLRRLLGVDLSPDALSSAWRVPGEALDVLRAAAADARKPSLDFTGGVARPLKYQHPGALWRTSGYESPDFEWVTSICGAAAVFPEVCIVDPVLGFLGLIDEVREEDLALWAPHVLDGVAQLAPLIDHQIVRVVALDRSQSRYQMLRAAIWQEATGGQPVFGGHGRQISRLVDALSVTLSTHGAIQVYLNERGLDLFTRVARALDLDTTGGPQPERIRSRVAVPVPANVTPRDLIDLRKSGLLGEWMQSLNNAVASCAAFMGDNADDELLSAWLAQELSAVASRMTNALSTEMSRSGIPISAFTLGIGVISAASVIGWGADAAMVAGIPAAASAGLAEVAARWRGAHTPGAEALRRHYAYFS